MTHHSFTFAGHLLHALPSGALHWPDRALLVVSDLHLGKSERLARQGGSLLPPYEVRATLARLQADIAATAARSVICLGDSFDDTAASAALDGSDRLWLTRLMAGRDWTWITGNHDPGHAPGHDPGPVGPVGPAGSHRAEIRLDAIALRHIATADTPEISGHYHPKARLAGRSRPCFLINGSRVILPAYGTYTGGLTCEDATLATLMPPPAIAVLTGETARAIPMPRSRAGRGEIGRARSGGLRSGRALPAFRGDCG